jgi:hypothetical protein
MRHGRARLDIERIHHHEVAFALAVVPARHRDRQRVLAGAQVADRDDGRVDLVGRAREEAHFPRRSSVHAHQGDPMPRPRLPIQRIEVPVKVIEAVAPAVDDCMAEPPLHPVGALLVQGR